MAVESISSLASVWTPATWEGIRLWGTFAMVGIGAIFAIGAFRREARRDRAREERELAEQASKVAAWVEGEVLRVRNASDLPIFDVGVRLGASRNRYKQNLDEISTQVIMSGLRHLHSWSTVIPASGIQEHQEVDLGAEIEVDHNPLIFLHFRDAQGVTWARIGGRLRILSPLETERLA